MSDQRVHESIQKLKGLIERTKGIIAESRKTIDQIQLMHTASQSEASEAARCSELAEPEEEWRENPS